MAVISMKQLLEAGVHFGHQTRRWNPKMQYDVVDEERGEQNERSSLKLVVACEDP